MGTDAGQGNRPPPTVWPAFRAKDAHAMVDYLVTTFGFLPTEVMEDDGIVVHAQLDWPEGGGVMLGQDRGGGAFAREPGTAGFYVVTDRVDEVHQRAVEHGAEVVDGPVDRDYGSREFMVRDPEGNLWSFGTYRGEPRR